MVESHGLHAIAKLGLNFNESLAITQKPQHRLTSHRRNMHGGKIPVKKQIEQQLGVTPVIFLAAQRAFSDDIGIANQQTMPEGFQQAMEPPCISGGFQPHDCGNNKLRVETTHVVMFVIERALVDQPVGSVTPTDGLGTSMKINSEIN